MPRNDRQVMEDIAEVWIALVAPLRHRSHFYCRTQRPEERVWLRLLVCVCGGSDASRATLDPRHGMVTMKSPSILPVSRLRICLHSKPVCIPLLRKQCEADEDPSNVPSLYPPVLFGQWSGPYLSAHASTASMRPSTALDAGHVMSDTLGRCVQQHPA